MHSRKVLLIGWDAADWKVIRPLAAAGQMPNLQRLIERGASGPIATLHPPLSPMLWTSIATGKRPFKHGILGFSEPAANGRDVRPISNISRKCKALWNILHQNGLSSVVVGWWPSHPAEPIRGAMVSDRFHRARGPLANGWPLPSRAVHPPELASALGALRVHPEQITPRLVQPFVPRAREIDQDQDNRLGMLLRVLAESLSVQSAALWLAEHQPWDLLAVYFDAIDHFCHAFMRYHPPRQSWVGERDFELYHNVVAQAYQLHDRMLGELLDKAGSATVVLLSDHGFHPDHLRPASIPDIPAGPAVEHRDFGVAVLSGPGIRRGHALEGASVLDITPTILALYGLPSGDDMDGKVLAPAFVDTPPPRLIPSWEDVPGADGRHPPHARLDSVAAHDVAPEMMEQMIALGYIERPSENGAIAAAGAARELRYNLAEAYQDAGRHADAREIFEELRAADPAERRFAVGLFASLRALGLVQEMRPIADEWPDLTAPLRIAEKRYGEALALLEPRAKNGAPPALLLQVADLNLHLRRRRAARSLYRNALAIDPDLAAAYLGLCRIALRERQFPRAAQAALDALERVHHDPLGHFLLGAALSGMKQFDRAAEAFRAAISLNPNFPEAHLRLAALLEKHLGDAQSAREHRLLARRMRTGEMPLEDSLIVVTGLPRSGTSMLMQALAAGGVAVLSDGLRQPDAANPRGYFEYEPVKNLLKESEWLREARGKAVKIVIPLLAALPAGLPCRVLLCERDLDEVLDSQDRMLRRDTPPDRRRTLQAEYQRALERARTFLAHRPATQLLIIEHRGAIAQPHAAAAKIRTFLGREFDEAKMAAAIDPALYRNRGEGK